MPVPPHACCRPSAARARPPGPVLLVLAMAALLVGLAGPVEAAATDPVGAWPLRPEHQVVAGFDPPRSAWGAGHRGVDLLGRTGAPVRAALPGRVVFAGRIAGRGVVVVDHGGTRTTYEPVVAAVEQGTEVRRGAVIGTLEVIGSHCFPRACLHWGWLRGTTYLDPLRLVGGGPVRLLPLAATPPVGAMAPGAARTSTTVPIAPVRPWGGPVRRPFVAGRW